MVPAVVLAGGLGTRLGELTRKTPKSLMVVANKPFIIHQVNLLRRNGITDIVLCLGHFGDQVQALLGDGRPWGVSVGYSFDGPQLLGTAGAIRKALHLLPGTFFVLYGDSYLDINYREVQDAFFASGRRALMTVLKNDGQWDQSNVLFMNGKVIEYRKPRPSPGMKHIDYGLGLFHRSVFEALPEGVAVDLVQVYQGLIAQSQLTSFEVR